MALAPAVSLGAPGIRVVSPEPQFRLRGVTRDTAAFFGIAPRGPARLPATTLEPDMDVATWLATAPRRRTVPVEVTSWDEYRHHFGGFEGPGRLPYAVSAFFANGGRRAWVARIVHDHGPADPAPARRATARLDGVRTTAFHPIRLFARSEGRWGNGLQATLSFRTRPLEVTVENPTRLLVDEREWVPGGSVLRLGHAGDVRSLAVVDRSELRPDPAGPGRHRVLTLAAPPPLAVVDAEVVIGDLEVVEDDVAVARREVIAEVGFRADHPRWLARAVLVESDLLWAQGPWVHGTLDLPDPDLPPVGLVDTDGNPSFAGGTDGWHHVVPEDFWDPTWIPGDETPGDGVHAIAEHEDIGLLLVPDLYEPFPLPEIGDPEPPRLCGPDFAEHDPVPAVQPTPFAPGLDGLALDPTNPVQLERIVTAQRAVLTHVDQRRDLTLLLDVPPGLDDRQILHWRNRFDSPFAAAYHPWLDVAAPDDARDALVRVNPSAFAAGITADRERRLGVQFGPANEIAIGAVRAADDIGPDRHGELHTNAINVFVPERDGIRLTAARTVSRRPQWRQLSVVRLMTIVRLTLLREMQWAAFEPNGPDLWREVVRSIHSYLTELYDARAFRGATTKEAFFVRCDRTTMTNHDLDDGRMICLVGIAPAEPTEYLVIEIAREADGSLGAEPVG